MGTDKHNITSHVASRIWVPVLLKGILAVLLGILFLTNTAATLLIIVMLLGAYWLIDGIFTLITSFQAKEHDKSWMWGILVGILSILAGLVVFLRPVLSTIFTTTFLVYFVGFMILISGISSIATGFRLRKTSGESVMIFGGILAVLLGLLLLFHPTLSLVMLVSMLGIFSFVGGVILIILSLRMRKNLKKAII